MSTTTIALEDVKPLYRHPEKRLRPERPMGRKPEWIRVKAPTSRTYVETKNLMRDNRLHTVCEEAGCPNIGECWSKKHATVMIMGDTCTRACTFCNVRTGVPKPLDTFEPFNLANAAEKMALKHIVVTSVDRDDLPDGGGAHFGECIKALRQKCPGMTIEILTPDFLRKPHALEILMKNPPDVFNHNLETVPRLYTQVRPGARYYHSLRVLDRVKEINPAMFTKSGIMVGLGETKEEIMQVMDDMRSANIDFITIGQYLQPTPKHHPVDRFVTPDEFAQYAKIARGKGFLMVASSPLTRSSYHAGEDFEKMRANREAQLSRKAAPKGE